MTQRLSRRASPAPQRNLGIAQNHALPVAAALFNVAQGRELANKPP